MLFMIICIEVCNSEIVQVDVRSKDSAICKMYRTPLERNAIVVLGIQFVPGILTDIGTHVSPTGNPTYICKMMGSLACMPSKFDAQKPALACKAGLEGHLERQIRSLNVAALHKKGALCQGNGMRSKRWRRTGAEVGIVARWGSEDDVLDFMEASKKGNLIPLCSCIFSDHLTPVLAYRCLVKEDDREAPSFLFESVEQGHEGTNVGRFSIIGAQPAMEIVAKENTVTIMDHEKGTRKEEFVDDPMAVPRRMMADWNPVLSDELPDAFCGGWVGYFSYDTVRYMEKKKLPFSKAPVDDRNLPDIHLGLYDDVIVFDHVEKKSYVIHWVQLDRYSSVEKAFEEGKHRLDILVSRVQDINPPRLSSGSVKLHTGLLVATLKNSNMTSEAYKKAIMRVKEHILAGDIFQIVLSQRFERRTFADPFEIYRALRVVNPSQYMIYLQARGCILVASSPEILTRTKKGKIINRPLAGTSRRGKTDKEDEMLEKELLNDEKQCAEHIMLVDLGRNDVGKVSKPGSVKVEKFMNVERYSHVMHISSTVIGELREDLTSWDALQAALPVGTVSGAPKVKAMELIDELEPSRRGPYSGGIGGVSFTGDMDIALALRTIVFPTFTRYDTMYSYKDIKNRREWVAHLQAGAGIVADSDPNDEHRECINKAAGLNRAIDLAESTFVDT